VRYVPILKGRAGELDALRSIQLRTRQSMLPLIEIAPRGESDDAAAVQKACEQTVEKLATRYLHPLMLDGGLFDLAADVTPGVGVVGLLANVARAKGLVAQPVIRLSDPQRARREAGDAHHADGRGLTIRLLGEDVDEDPEDLDVMLQAVLDDTGTSRTEVDLIFDLGAIDGDVAVRGGARLVVSLLRDLPQIDAWRSITVASGAFPVDLSQFTAWVIGERPRFDAQLFDRVRKLKLPRYPDYGDYAVAHPVLTLGVTFSPPPQLRYTTGEHWLVLKGRRTDPTGNAQFQRICSIIANHPEFAGTPVGHADVRIAAGSPEGVGNGTTWRMIGTTHHLDFVALRLTSLGEP
jgi:hypothetical protein